MKSEELATAPIEIRRRPTVTFGSEFVTGILAHSYRWQTLGLKSRLAAKQSFTVGPVLALDLTAQILTFK